MSNQALSIRLPPQWLDKQDTDFFKRFPTRRTHIRKPMGAECEREFRTLGDHVRDRRRIVLWRVPEGNPYYDELKKQLGQKITILKIPFLLFSTETVEDEDAILIPIVDTIMREAAHGMD